MEIRFYGVFVLNHRVVLHAIDATPARWRGGVGLSPLDGASTAASSSRNDLVSRELSHPTHWLISTQQSTNGTAAIAAIAMDLRRGVFLLGDAAA